MRACCTGIGFDGATPAGSQTHRIAAAFSYAALDCNLTPLKVNGSIRNGKT